MGVELSCQTKSVDFTKFNIPILPVEKDAWEVILKCVIMGILILLGIVGNTLIIVIVSLSKKMRTTTNFYIVNMALADLLVACFPMWIHVASDVTEGWILGGFLCRFNAFLQTSAMAAISFTMMVIAGDRFFAIVFPLKARVTQSKAKIMVVIIWLSAISIGIPPLVFYQYKERQWKDHLETFCVEIWPVRKTSTDCDHGATSKRIYWTIFIAALNWIPMLVMTINYTVIIHRLHFSRVAQSSTNGQSDVQRKSTRKVIKMLFCLLIAFMVCTIPFQVSSMYENNKDIETELPEWYEHVYFSAVSLMYAHSTINPFIYGAMNKNFKDGFRELVGRCYGRPQYNSQSETRYTGVESLRPSIHTVNSGKMYTYEPGTDSHKTIDPSTYLNKLALDE